MPTYVRGKGRRKMDDETIVRLYVSGKDAESIGYEAGCSGTTVLNLVRSAGYPVRASGRGAPRPRSLTDDEIIRRYRDGQSGPLIADAAGCTPGTIYHLLRRLGVAVRAPITRNGGRRKEYGDG